MLVLLTAIALAASPVDTLARAQRHYDDLAFDQAAAVLVSLLESEPPAETRERALLLLGFCEILLGRTPAAEAHFRELLTRTPKLVLPSGTSPKLSRVFEGVRAEVLLVPRMTPRAPFMSPAPASGAVRLSFDAENVVAEQEPALRYRVRGEQVFAARPLIQTSAGHWFAELTELSAEVTLEYYVDAKVTNVRTPIFASQKSPESVTWAGSRKADEPIAIKPAPPPASAPTAPRATATPVTKRWWFWTVLAASAVVVAGATTAIVLSQQPPAADIRVVNR